MRSSDMNRARRAGFAAGLAGEPARSPYTSPPLARRWLAAWSDGRSAKCLASLVRMVTPFFDAIIGVARAAEKALGHVAASYARMLGA